MPVFVSRFSSNRVAGANLQRIRSQAEQTNERTATNEAQRNRQSERSQESDRTQQSTERAREALLVRTQTGQQIAQQLQTRRTEQTATQTTQAAQTTRQAEPPAQQPRTEQTSGRRLQTPPGVGITRTQADENIDRPGRLNRTPANPIRQQQLDRFASLRAVRNSTPATTQPANAQNTAGRINTRVRALSAQLQPQGRAIGQQTTPFQTPAQTETPVAIPTPTARETNITIQPPTAQAATIQQPAETPTAEEISRANTTPEIRENLQQDAREVATGLSRDAIRQTQQTTQQTAQTAERADESRQTETQREGRAQIRELQTEERQLSRELQQTQRNIRQERLRVQRAQGVTSSSTTATAASIGTNVNILAG